MFDREPTAKQRVLHWTVWGNPDKELVIALRPNPRSSGKAKPRGQSWVSTLNFQVVNPRRVAHDRGRHVPTVKLEVHAGRSRDLRHTIRFTHAATVVALSMV